jgi:hypothetical protein
MEGKWGGGRHFRIGFRISQASSPRILRRISTFPEEGRNQLGSTTRSHVSADRTAGTYTSTARTHSKTVELRKRDGTRSNTWNQRMCKCVLISVKQNFQASCTGHVSSCSSTTRRGLQCRIPVFAFGSEILNPLQLHGILLPHPTTPPHKRKRHRRYGQRQKPQQRVPPPQAKVLISNRPHKR